MPYQSDAQARLMRAVAHSPEFAKKVGIPTAVGRKFEAHKAEGGTVKNAMMKKIFAGKETAAEEGKEKAAAKKAGMTYKAAERKFEGEYANGGRATFPAVKGSATKSGLDAGNKSADGIAQRGKTRGDNIVMKAKGGSCYARGGGVETKGKTRGRFV
jgi:hypothetical protein